MMGTQIKNEDAQQSDCIKTVEELNKKIKEIYDEATVNYEVAFKYITTAEHFIAKTHEELVMQIVDVIKFEHDEEKRKRYYEILQEVKEDKSIIFVEVEYNDVSYYSASTVYTTILLSLYKNNEVCDELAEKIGIENILINCIDVGDDFFADD